MKSLTLIFSTLLFLFTASTLVAQTAEEIVANYLETIGGEEALTAIKTVKMSGKAKAQGMDIPMTMYQKAPGMMRMDIVFQGKEITQMAFDGEEGWSTNFMTMEAEKWDAEQSQIMRSDMEFLNAFLNYEDKGYKISLEGEEAIEGVDCFKVKLTKKPVVIDDKEEENFSFYYFDKETFVPIMQVEYAKSGPMKGKATETYFSDYQEVDGVYFAHTISQKFEGNPVFDVALEEIILNPDMPDSEFSYPEVAAEGEGK